MEKLDQITWDNFLDNVEEVGIIDINDGWDLEKLDVILLNHYNKEKPEIIKILLETGNLLDNQVEIPGSFFERCSNLSNVTIPEGVTTIGGYAFKSCVGLTSISLPDTLTNIGQFAFENCINLTSITLPDKLTSIGPYAFYRCSSLTSIVIPKSVKDIEDSAFYGCWDLIIYCEASDRSIEYDEDWDFGVKSVYYEDEWEYVNGVPTPIKK